MDSLLVQPDPGLFIWTILTFLVLLYLLRKFAWTPLLAALENRQEVIKKSLEDAEKARRELERVSQESRQIISQARAEAQSILARGRSEAETLRVEVKQKARAEADSILREAERQIQLETAKALSKIRHEVVDLSLLVASKLIKKHLSKEDDDSLIEESLKQIEASRM
jgi:F-type H+-transporting ATPase subunit b